MNPTYLDQNERVLVEEVDSLIGKRPDGTDFTNGGGFLRHKTIDALKAWRALMELLSIRHSSRTFVGIPFAEKTSIGRYLDDVRSPYYPLFMRFICMESSDMPERMTMREWGQPYFALNPDRGKQICRNEVLWETRTRQGQMAAARELGDRKVEV